MERKTRNNQRTAWRPDRTAAFSNAGDTAVPLMQFVAGKLPDAKRNDIKAWLKHGQVKLAGSVTSQFDEPVEPGAIVEINFSRSWPQFRHQRMTIVYEDDDIIVVNKGYGLLSVGTGSLKKEETAYGILKNYVKSINPANKIFVVHRLDRGTSGLMMFAKSMEAQAAMQHNWKNMVIDRRYVALLEGVVENDKGTICSNLGETSQYEVYSSQEEGDGKPAVTRYEVIKRSHGYTLAEEPDPRPRPRPRPPDRRRPQIRREVKPPQPDRASCAQPEVRPSRLAQAYGLRASRASTFPCRNEVKTLP